MVSSTVNTWAVLRFALGYPDEEARGALRFSLGRTTTEAEVDEAIEVVPRILRQIREGAALLASEAGAAPVGAAR